MYSETDLSIINSSYFTIIDLESNYCTLKSNNTGHGWQICKSDDGYYILMHRHRDTDKMHFHSAGCSIEDCILDIVNHDDFQLRGRKPAKYKYHSYFDEILEIYKNASLTQCSATSM